MSSGGWRRVGFLSDLHVGSIFAVWPDSWTTEDGNTITANPGQQVLRQYWDDFLTHEIQDAEIIVLMADLCQGNNRKEFGRDLTVAELKAQADVAASMLASACQGRTVFGVSGSRYHNAMEVSLDRMVTEQVGGKFLGMLKHLRINGTDHVIQVAHGGSGGGVLYEGTLLDRDVGLMLRAEGEQKFDFHVSMIVRGHRHRYAYFETETGAYLALPCWQTWTPWSPMVEKFGKRQPSIGGVCVDFGPDGRVQHHKRVYPLVHIHDSLLEV